MATWRLQVQTNYSGGGGPGYNAFHFRDAGSSGTALFDDLQAATVVVKDFYNPIKGAFVGSSIGTDGVWSPVGGGSLAVDTDGWTLNPTGGDATVPFAAILVQWRTLRPGRTGRGRSFLGPLAAAAVGGDGKVSGTLRSSVNAAANALAGSGGGPGDGSFVVYSPSSGISSDIQSATVWDQFASLPSRRD